MIAECHICGRLIANVPREDAEHPGGYECAACWQTRHGVSEPEEDDEPADRDATPLIEGDDPDNNITDPGEL